MVRADPDGQLRRYGHIGTGNYNPETAENYEDIGFFTADEVLTADLAELFNMLTSHSRHGNFERLLVAPVNLLSSLLELIRAQAHSGGRIVIKVNNLTHIGVIDALCAASQAGCEIDLIVRSTCRLRPGVEGVSNTIRVRSIVGPVLEHSRIFRFGAPTDDVRQYFIGSADLMVRNLENRVEAVVPVDDPALRTRPDETLDVCLADEELAWTLAADGSWTPCTPHDPPPATQAEPSCTTLNSNSAVDAMSLADGRRDSGVARWSGRSEPVDRAGSRVAGNDVPRTGAGGGVLEFGGHEMSSLNSVPMRACR